MIPLTDSLVQNAAFFVSMAIVILCAAGVQVLIERRKRAKGKEISTTSEVPWYMRWGLFLAAVALAFWIYRPFSQIPPAV
ncbi:MAG TPA: hypothetical protein VI485_00060 [Vicinamibacterales bacterium]|nr:hypothetical protein [Vicinamibacterales bacterium]